MKAFVLEKGVWNIRDMPETVPRKDEVAVALKTAGLNRRDLYIPNRAGKEGEALIIGSDGAGIVEAVGDNVQHVKVGDEVIINPALRWENNSDAPPEGFDILGMPDHGTIAEKIVIDSRQVEPKPAHLNWEEAGVLALAGLTGYRALVTKGGITKGQTVFIPGAGSGVATYMIQFAKALGAKVIVSSRSSEKRRKALKLGADVAVDTNENWEEALSGETIDLVIDSVGAATFNDSLAVLKKGGRMVVFGATAGDVIELDVRAFFYGQYQLFGSTMGSREELQAMLELVEKNKIHPVVGGSFSIEEINEALKMLEENRQFGKIAIRID